SRRMARAANATSGAVTTRPIRAIATSNGRLTPGNLFVQGGEEAGRDRGGDGAAGFAVLDQDGEGEIVAVGNEPGVGRGRIPGAVLGGAALAVYITGHGGQRGAGAGGDHVTGHLA